MPKNSNASYDNCISKLQSRYEDRGVKANAQNEAKVQIKKEASAPNAYLVSRMNRPSAAENYRNGEYNGQKYMTTGDFLKYYNSRKDTFNISKISIPKGDAAQTKEFRSTPAVEARSAEQARSATPQARAQVSAQKPKKGSRFDPNARTIEMPSIAQQKGLRQKVGKLVDKWFPKEDKKENTATFKRSVPVAAIGLIISSTIAMTMIIGSSVMASQATLEVSDLKYEIAALEKESCALDEKLTKKENLDEIKAYATENLGMISKDYVSAEYVCVSAEQKVVRHGDESQENIDFSNLLSSILGE